MPAPFPGLDTVNATTDLSALLIYVNTLSGGIFGTAVLASFFLIVMLGSYFIQVRISGRGRMDTSFAAAGFTTFGLAAIMTSINGLVSSYAVLVTLAMAIIGIAWILFSEPSY